MGTNYPLIVLKYLFLMLLFIGNVSVNSKVIEPDVIAPMFPIDINRQFEKTATTSMSALFDLVDKENKVSSCVAAYIKRQSRSYTRQTQDNLYNLMNNFDNIISRLYNKQVAPDDITHNEKVEVLARIQCEAFYKMGILK